jgi:hypothetical protein
MVRPNYAAALVCAYFADPAAGSIADGLNDSVNLYPRHAVFLCLYCSIYERGREKGKEQKAKNNMLYRWTGELKKPPGT